MTSNTDPVPPEGCVCASFWTVRHAHKKDCPLYVNTNRGQDGHLQSDSVNESDAELEKILLKLCANSGVMPKSLEQAKTALKSWRDAACAEAERVGRIKELEAADRESAVVGIGYAVVKQQYILERLTSLQQEKGEKL